MFKRQEEPLKTRKINNDIKSELELTDESQKVDQDRLLSDTDHAEIVVDQDASPVSTTNGKRLRLVDFHKPYLAKSLTWTLAGAALLNWSIQLLSGTTVYPLIAVLAIVSGAWGIAVVLGSWLKPVISIKSRYISIAVIGISIVFFITCFAAWFFIQLRSSPSYGTDEIAFNQYAALLVSHGLNPYTHSMLPSFTLYKVSPDGFTYHLNGTPVTTLSYPSLSFLLYVPFILLGWSTQMAIIINAIFWAITVTMLVIMLPTEFKGLGIILGSIASYASYTIGGVTDIMYLPFLLIAAYSWPWFITGRGWRKYLSPTLFGLAMAIKQTPWLDAPFILAAIILETQINHPWKVTLKKGAYFTTITAIAFIIPNLPYIIINPHAWIKGALTPFAKDIVPAGQGVVGFSIFLHLGGGSLSSYSLLTISVLLILIVGYIFTYPLLRPVTFLLASVILFFATRSFGSYLVCLIPVLLVASLITENDGSLSKYEPKGKYFYTQLVWLKSKLSKSLLLGFGLLVFLVPLYIALSSSPPLKLKIISLRSTGQLATVEQLSVSATNTTDHPVSPYFSINEGGSITTFWRIAKGPAKVMPGKSAVFLLQAPNFPSQPSIAGGFQVDAFTTSPETVSASSPYSPASDHVFLTPDAVNQPLRVGKKIVIKAEILNQINQPVHESGIPIYMGQIIYDQLGLLYSEAIINNAQPGETPVSSYTNADGVATFTIVGTQVTQDPVYFEANLVSPTGFYPYGYSQILSIRFRS